MVLTQNMNQFSVRLLFGNNDCIH